MRYFASGDSPSFLKDLFTSIVSGFHRFIVSNPHGLTHGTMIILYLLKYVDAFSFANLSAPFTPLVSYP